MYECILYTSSFDFSEGVRQGVDIEDGLGEVEHRDEAEDVAERSGDGSISIEKRENPRTEQAEDQTEEGSDDEDHHGHVDGQFGARQYGGKEEGHLGHREYEHIEHYQQHSKVRRTEERKVACQS